MKTSNEAKEDNPDVVNFYEQINSIKKRYGSNFWRNPKAQKELADFWGPSPNDSMVLPHETETIVDIGSCKGQIYFAHTSKNYWLIGLSASSAFNGVSYAPSVMDHEGYRTYHSARKEGVKKLINFFEAVTHDSSSCNSVTNKGNALKAISFLRSELTPQLNLFE